MFVKRLSCLSFALLAGCTSSPLTNSTKTTTHLITPTELAKAPTLPPAPPSHVELTLDAYKEVLARHISDANASKVYPGRPQALLRSVIVLKFYVDAEGRLVKSEIVRSNHDLITEGTALTSLRGAAPFPKPSARLLARGRMEISETWLFNNDGRFQLRSIAQPQMDR